MTLGSSKWARDLPEVSRFRARVLVLSLGGFWVLAAAPAEVIDGPLGVPVVLGALAAGWTFYATLFRVWARPMFVWPGRGYVQRYSGSMEVILSLFRPAFLGRVLRATGWPPALVAVALAALLAGAIAGG